MYVFLWKIIGREYWDLEGLYKRIWWGDVLRYISIVWKMDFLLYYGFFEVGILVCFIFVVLYF